MEAGSYPPARQTGTDPLSKSAKRRAAAREFLSGAYQLVSRARDATSKRVGLQPHHERLKAVRGESTVIMEPNETLQTREQSPANFRSPAAFCRRTNAQGAE